MGKNVAQTVLLQGAPLRKMWHGLYRSMLDTIFHECDSNGIIVMPDQAIDLMENLFSKKIEGGSHDDDEARQFFRFDWVAFRCEAHHYAVDKFYKTYYGRRKGATPLPISYLSQILILHEKGLNDAQIAAELGQRREAIRKQIKIAKQRWSEKIKAVHEMGEKIAESKTTQKKKKHDPRSPRK